MALGEHLIDQGARRITFVGDPDTSPDVAERWTGLKWAASERDAEIGFELELEHDLDEAAGARVAQRYLGRSSARPLPDAFACANDELALGLLDTLRAAGVDVPGTVKVTGWDDVMAARYAGLTTVRQPMRQLGATAARLLDELIVGTRTEPRHELLPTTLVTRTSS